MIANNGVYTIRTEPVRNRGGDSYCKVCVCVGGGGGGRGAKLFNFFSHLSLAVWPLAPFQVNSIAFDSAVASYMHVNFSCRAIVTIIL